MSERKKTLSLNQFNLFAYRYRTQNIDWDELWYINKTARDRAIAILMMEKAATYQDRWNWALDILKNEGLIKN